MLQRRLVPYFLLVIALLAIVALAAGGRPLGTSPGRSSGLPHTFWDYVFTTLVILLLMSAIVAAVLHIRMGRGAGPSASYHARTARALTILLAVILFAVFVARHLHLKNLLHPTTPTTASTVVVGPPANGPGKHHHAARPPVRFQWPELAAVAGVLALLGVILVARRLIRNPELPWLQDAPDVLAAALDESLDDLRTEPDVRKAIIAAYARMERALAAAGLPRRPAEAPLEYVERALLALDTSAGAVRRLTDLFEWARFSHHEPEPEMRDEAIEALAAVRDELRASQQVAA
jgi:hypothetical protein